MRNTILRMAGLTALVVSCTVSAAGSVWPPPGKPVQIAVLSPAGGGIDAPLARLLAQKLTTHLNTPFTFIGHAPPHTTSQPNKALQLVLTGVGMQTTRPGMYRAMPFDPREHYMPVSLAARFPTIIAVTKALPVNNLDEFTRYLRLNPGVVNVASSGNGSVSHVASMLFMTLTDTNMVPVTFSSASQATSNLVSGEIQSMFHVAPEIAEQVKRHKIKALAVMGNKRLSSLPHVPTTTELGHPELQQALWLGLMAPKETPAETIKSANTALNEVLADPDVMARIASMGAIVQGGTPQEFDRRLSTELAKWRALLTNGYGPPSFP
ncbi:tripartite tricarboxylate transporter substrate binding protein [Pusillimonas sp. ANT_WB101]|uniref:Bug family tripartite tricarboxylate transporter substrate binding protein n=1 Tax=Pusillimonas sp. ANT_WB101 TaxID=2597356 RepID=UPI00165DBEBC|nr:tripartite tricarboxylate transporter substrate binding protein [Pusillimonas sp. ANT_WB101]